MKGKSGSLPVSQLLIKYQLANTVLYLVLVWITGTILYVPVYNISYVILLDSNSFNLSHLCIDSLASLAGPRSLFWISSRHCSILSDTGTLLGNKTHDDRVIGGRPLCQPDSNDNAIPYCVAASNVVLVSLSSYWLYTSRPYILLHIWSHKLYAPQKHNCLIVHDACGMLLRTEFDMQPNQTSSAAGSRFCRRGLISRHEFLLLILTIWFLPTLGILWHSLELKLLKLWSWASPWDHT